MPDNLSPLIADVAFHYRTRFRRPKQRKFRNIAVGATTLVLLRQVSSRDAPILARLNFGITNAEIVYRCHNDKLYRRVQIGREPLPIAELAQIPLQLESSTVPQNPDHPFPFWLPRRESAELDNIEIYRFDELLPDQKARDSAAAEIADRAQDIIVIDGVLYQRALPPMLALTAPGVAQQVKIHTATRWHIALGMIDPTLFFPLDDEDGANRTAALLGTSRQITLAVEPSLNAMASADVRTLSAPEFQVDWRPLVLSAVKQRLGNFDLKDATPANWGWNCLMRLLPSSVSIEYPFRAFEAIADKHDILMGAFNMLAPMVTLPERDRQYVNVLCEMARLRQGTPCFENEFLRDRWSAQPRAEDITKLLEYAGPTLHGTEVMPETTDAFSLRRARLASCYQSWRMADPRLARSQDLAKLMTLVLAATPADGRARDTGLDLLSNMARNVLDGLGPDEPHPLDDLIL